MFVSKPIWSVLSDRFGSMIAFFRYSPIDILSVHLPPSKLEFEDQVQQDWLKKEAEEVIMKFALLLT